MSAAAPEASAQPTMEVKEPTTTVVSDDTQEPQNVLTQKFTEAEWKALKELRVSSLQDFDRRHIQ